MPEFIGPIESKYTSSALDDKPYMNAASWRAAALSALEDVLWCALNQPEHIADSSGPMRAEWRLRQSEFAAI